MIPILAFAKDKISIKLIIIWSYRFVGITFGGLVISKSGKCVVNKKLKIVGNIMTFLLSIYFLIQMVLTFKQDRFEMMIYDSGFKIIYYIQRIWRQMNIIYIIYNLFYYQYKGFNLFEIWFSFPIKSLKNKIIIISYFILTNFAFFILLVMRCLSARIKTTSDVITFLLDIISLIYHSIGQYTIKMITWCKLTIS
jgi:hypothetical protein